MDLNDLEEFKRAAGECSGLAEKTTDLDRKASLQDLAWSYQNLADNLKKWADMAAAERVILDAARASLMDEAGGRSAPLWQAPSVIPELFLARKSA
jgi:hypothetical protein